MDQNVEKFINSNYAITPSVEVAPDGTQKWAAWPFDLPGCIAQGESSDEAEANLRSILPGVLQRLASSGMDVPEPTVFPHFAMLKMGFYNEASGAPMPNQPLTSLEGELQTA